MNKKDNTIVESKFCSNCGCELMSSNKYNKCENCRRKKAGKLGKFLKVGGTVITTGLIIATKGKFSGKK